MDVLPTLAGRVDAVITDIPYNIPVGSAFVRLAGKEVHDGAGGFNQIDDPWAWVRFASSLVVNGGHVAAFFDRADPVSAYASLRANGLEPWHKYYLVKDAPPPTPRPTFVSAVEECIIAERRTGGVRRSWFGGGYVPNRWCGLTPNRLGNDDGHPSQKPVEPMRVLIEALTPPGGTVLDPFCGSGTTGVACMQTGRNFIGIELDAGYCEIARRRIGEAANHLFAGGAN